MTLLEDILESLVQVAPQAFSGPMRSQPLLLALSQTQRALRPSPCPWAQRPPEPQAA
jgi:hypothetical protein